MSSRFVLCLSFAVPLLTLGLVGCGDPALETGLGPSMDSGADAMDAGMGVDAFRPDARATDSRGGSTDVGLDQPGSCSGDPPLCYELVDDYLCSQLSVQATCLGGEWSCPVHYRVADECPTNPMECPDSVVTRFEMHEESCSISVEAECFYAGPAGVPCPGGLFACACDEDQWSCVCLY